MKTFKHLTMALVISTVAGSAAVAQKPRTRMNVKELVASADKLGWQTPVRVRFEVAGISKVPTSFPDGKMFSVPHLAPLGTGAIPPDPFSAPLSAEVVGKLWESGAPDPEEYFVGKVVEIQGRISQAGVSIGFGSTYTMYHIAIDSRDQVHIVETEELAGVDDVHK